MNSLDVAQNTSISTIWCRNNQLTSLDVSQNTTMNSLACSGNQLTSLDISQNLGITTFWCNDNELTSLNVKNGNNTNFTTFEAIGNPNLTCIEVDDVSYSEANWVNIDPQTSFSEDCSQAQTYVPDDNFEQALIDLGYDSGTLDDFVATDAINSIINLDIRDKNISDLTGIEDFTDLEQLICRNNQLNTLDISQNLALTDLQCEQNLLSSLDVSENTLLRNIRCFSNQLTSLDISQNTVLTNLNCHSNLLTTVNTNFNTDLIQFSCHSNQITSLDLSENPDLLGLVCSGNQLTSLNLKNGNNVNMTQVIATNNPNLNCIEVDDVNYSETNWTNIDAQTVFSEDCSALNTTSFELENQIVVFPNPASQIIHIKTPNNSLAETIEIVSITGENTLSTSLKSSLNVSELASGIYLMKITLDDQVIIKKLIIQ